MALLFHLLGQVINVTLKCQDLLDEILLFLLLSLSLKLVALDLTLEVLVLDVELFVFAGHGFD